MKKFTIIRPDDHTTLKVAEGPDDALAAVLSYEIRGDGQKSGDYYLEGFARLQTAERDLAHLRKSVENEGRGHVTVGIEERRDLFSGISSQRQ